MAKIGIGRVVKGANNYNVQVILTEPIQVGEEVVDNPIGEAFLPIPHGLEMSKVKECITKTAQEIMKAHQDALDKKKDIEELEFPAIT